MMDLEKRIKRVVVQTLKDEPFWGSLLVAMDIRIGGVPAGAKAMVDPRGVIYVHESCEGLSDAELKGLLYHEVLHIVLCHFVRKGNRDMRGWNIATDLAINSGVLKGYRLPAGGLFAAMFGMQDDLAAEEYYRRIVSLSEAGGAESGQSEGQSGNRNGQRGRRGDRDEGEERNGQGGGERDQQDEGGDGKGKDRGAQAGGQNGSGGGKDGGKDEGVEGENGGGEGDGRGEGVVIGGEGFDRHMVREMKKEEAEKIEEKWKGVLVRAVSVAKEIGKMPAGIESVVEKLLRSRVDWRTVLANFVRRSRNGYKWDPPHRRHLMRGVIMPSVRSEDLEIVICVDTSGSISQREMELFLSEVQGILSSARSYHVWYVQVDADVQRVKEIRSPRRLPDAKVKGGGGTDFRPVWEWMRKKGLRLPVVFFTDGYATFGEGIKGVEVLWVLTSDVDVPFGRRIVLEVES